MSRSPTFKVRVFGPYACFTRPELKAERVSYEIITPSAARGVLEAILWKPAIRWRVERIHVLAPIRWDAVKRNEVGSKANLKSAYQAYCADEDRQQRNTLLLRDVDYVVEAHFRMTERAGPGDNLAKFVEMFERRLAKGQTFHSPYLGCREFAASVLPAPAQWAVPEAVRGDRDLGLMLNDLVFDEEGRKPPQPVFFEARLRDGVVEVPEVRP
jgi:CRISPR-associated protein Cas5d